MILANVYDARTQLSALLERAAAGEEIVLGRGRQTDGSARPCREAPTPRVDDEVVRATQPAAWSRRSRVMVSSWNVHQHRQMKQVVQQQKQSEQVSEIRTKQARQIAEGADVRIDRLVLLTEAMWELLMEHYGFTPEHLAHKAAEIDARDGHSDGRRTVQGQAPPCRSCGAAISREHAKCVFCGEAASLDDMTPFDRI